jgi:hypothetical protein
MLAVLNVLQLLLYIPLLALLGQGALFVLAGSRRHDNLFYRLLTLVSRPFVVAVRRLTPKWLAERTVVALSFCLILLAYAVVTLEKISWCVQIGLAACR